MASVALDQDAWWRRRCLEGGVVGFWPREGRCEGEEGFGLEEGCCHRVVVMAQGEPSVVVVCRRPCARGYVVERGMRRCI